MDRAILEQKAQLCADKLIHLGGADYDADKNIALKDAFRTGIVARDAGIEEWDWPQGVGLYGLYRLQAYYGDNRYQDFFADWYKKNIEKGLPSKNINTTAPLLPLVGMMDGFSEKEEYEKLCLDRAEWLMHDLPKTIDGGFQHVTSAIGDRNGVILNEQQLWVDTLFMAVLFLQQMGNRYQREDWKQEVVHQFLVHIKYLYEKSNGLFYHGYSFLREDNFGGIFWARGNSWFTLGVTLFLEAAKDVEDGTLRFVKETFVRHAQALKKLQGEDGLFHTILDDPTSYTETSGTAAIAAGLLRGIRMGLLDDSFCETADKAVEALCNQIDQDGTVLGVSAGTGVGMDAEHYRNIVIRPMAYGQSLTLIALAEALIESN